MIPGEIVPQHGEITGRFRSARTIISRNKSGVELRARQGARHAASIFRPARRCPLSRARAASSWWRSWFDEVKKARLTITADVKRSYATATIISADRVVFNIKGNDYRLVVAVDYEKAIVWIKWIGTHKDYNKIDVNEVEHER
jgi:mRNA interferase HigB